MDYKEFEQELTTLLNRHSVENESDTPDFVLASYLVSCLKSFTEASNTRVKWLGGNELPAPDVRT